MQMCLQAPCSDHRLRGIGNNTQDQTPPVYSAHVLSNLLVSFQSGKSSIRFGFNRMAIVFLLYPVGNNGSILRTQIYIDVGGAWCVVIYILRHTGSRQTRTPQKIISYSSYY